MNAVIKYDLINTDIAIITILLNWCTKNSDKTPKWYENQCDKNILSFLKDTWSNNVIIANFWRSIVPVTVYIIQLTEAGTNIYFESRTIQYDLLFIYS